MVTVPGKLSLNLILETIRQIMSFGLRNCSHVKPNNRARVNAYKITSKFYVTIPPDSGKLSCWVLLWGPYKGWSSSCTDIRSSDKSARKLDKAWRGRVVMVTGAGCHPVTKGGCHGNRVKVAWIINRLAKCSVLALWRLYDLKSYPRNRCYGN